MATSTTKTTKTAKSAKVTAPVDEDVVKGELMTDAEAQREEQLEMEDLLADMPAILSTRRFRLRHKNQLKEIANRYQADIVKARELAAEDKPLTAEIGLRLEAMAGEVDMFAQTIAEDAEAYENWAIEKSDDVSVFVALLTKLMGALGE